VDNWCEGKKEMEPGIKVNDSAYEHGQVAGCETSLKH